MGFGELMAQVWLRVLISGMEERDLLFSRKKKVSRKTMRNIASNGQSVYRSVIFHVPEINVGLG